MDPEDDPSTKSDGTACGGLRHELKECILKSDCVVKHGNHPTMCMKTDVEGVSDDCRKIQYAFFECKRSLLDFRTRFRGRKGY
ncbi:cytochrome c oxidase assembly factor 5 [Exaiptasia diaphana]|uniref:Cytochrome c oxidase assembly factor 5 n=1 Tax=Exaiptasia diaphana TaxID=2652724 RepID=A0A913XJB6_EXADI|nr:cytochrome c oxidase assembly factor 5 [Exaiptasia diaphana]KXJ25888.1 Cytochrome c oxidase assembly factor 5 [Exaiptasia diaphana]